MTPVDAHAPVDAYRPLCHGVRRILAQLGPGTGRLTLVLRHALGQLEAGLAVTARADETTLQALRRTWMSAALAESAIGLAVEEAGRRQLIDRAELGVQRTQLALMRRTRNEALRLLSSSLSTSFDVISMSSVPVASCVAAPLFSTHSAEEIHDQGQQGNRSRNRQRSRQGVHSGAYESAQRGRRRH